MILQQISTAENYLQQHQQKVLQKVQDLSDQVVTNESWRKATGEPLQGRGRTIIIQSNNPHSFESGAINWSSISAQQLPKAATVKKPKLANLPYAVSGLSMIFHHNNPWVPTAHCNVRYFRVGDYWWIGGGYDLTPYYPKLKDCTAWHLAAQKAVNFGEVDLYSDFKQQCDNYFYLPHRKECRGIGGLFFDDFSQNGKQFCSQLLHNILQQFIASYFSLVARHYQKPFTQQQRDFVCYRRGRYVEFNLLYDRGTLFGLQSKGRVESILSSLPQRVHWSYNWQPEPNSAEQKLTGFYLKPQDWVNMDV